MSRGTPWKGVGPKSPAASVASPKVAPAQQEWRLRFSPRILREDLKEIGEAAYAVAKEAIIKKLKQHPNQYGAPLRTPLAGMRKLSVSHVRIVYRVDDDLRQVLIYMIGARRDIWTQDQPEIRERAAELAETIMQEQKAILAKQAGKAPVKRPRK